MAATGARKRMQAGAVFRREGCAVRQSECLRGAATSQAANGSSSTLRHQQHSPHVTLQLQAMPYHQILKPQTLQAAAKPPAATAGVCVCVYVVTRR